MSYTSTNLFNLLSDEPVVENKQEVQKPKEKTTKVARKNNKQKGRKDGQKEGGQKKGGRREGKNKREFDRRSGTGRGKESQKNGAGKYNWGKEGEIIETDENAKEGNEKENKRRRNRKGKKGSNDQNEGEDANKKSESEDEGMDYGTYLKNKQERMVKEERKVRQVANDNSQFKTVQALSKDDGSDLMFVVKSDAGQAGKKKNRKNKPKKISLDEFSGQGKSDSGNRRGNRRDNNRGQKGRNNKNKQNQRNKKRNVNIADESAFPSLG